MPSNELLQDQSGYKFDRWIGQCLDKEQIDTIYDYYWASEWYDRPIWSRAFEWWYEEMDLTSFGREPWDFGLEGDTSTLDAKNIRWCGGLWRKLNERREALITYYQPLLHEESNQPCEP